MICRPYSTLAASGRDKPSVDTTVLSPLQDRWCHADGIEERGRDKSRAYKTLVSRGWDRRAWARQVSPLQHAGVRRGWDRRAWARQVSPLQDRWCHEDGIDCAGETSLAPTRRWCHEDGIESVGETSLAPTDRWCHADGIESVGETSLAPTDRWCHEDGIDCAGETSLAPTDRWCHEDGIEKRGRPDSLAPT